MGTGHKPETAEHTRFKSSNRPFEHIVVTKALPREPFFCSARRHRGFGGGPQKKWRDSDLVLAATPRGMVGLLGRARRFIFSAPSHLGFRV